MRTVPEWAQYGSNDLAQFKQDARELGERAALYLEDMAEDSSGTLMTSLRAAEHLRVTAERGREAGQ